MKTSICTVKTINVLNVGGGEGLFKHEIAKGENSPVPQMCVPATALFTVGTRNREQEREVGVAVPGRDAHEIARLAGGGRLTIPLCVCERKYVCRRKYQKDRPQLLITNVILTRWCD